MGITLTEPNNMTSPCAYGVNVYTTMTLGTVTIRFSRPVITAISLIRARQKGIPDHPQDHAEKPAAQNKGSCQ
jgi:hypothetical protein